MAVGVCGGIGLVALFRAVVHRQCKADFVRLPALRFRKIWSVRQVICQVEGDECLQVKM